MIKMTKARDLEIKARREMMDKTGCPPMSSV